MRAYEIGDFPTTRRLTPVERPDPVPGPGEAVIRVRYTGINARDFSILGGAMYSKAFRPSLIPLCDNAGEVLAVGEGVTEVSPGDRVTMAHYCEWMDGAWDVSMTRTDYGMSVDGFLAEQRVVPAAVLVKIPDGVSLEDAATLASAGLTAWQAVVELARPGPGDTVVTLGTGGVSMFAMQWAAMLGARVIVTSSDEGKIERAKALGAAEGINYRQHPAWSKEVMRLTDGRGAQVVVNTVGMAELDQCLEASTSGGKVMLIGANPTAPGRDYVAPPAPVRLSVAIIRDLTIKGVVVGSRRMLVDMLAAMAERSLRPVIDSVWGFEEADEAIEYVRGGDKLGKVLIRVS